MPLFCRKKEMGGAAGTRGEFARGCRKEIRRREEKIAENAGPEMHFRRKSAELRKNLHPEWKRKGIVGFMWAWLTGEAENCVFKHTRFLTKRFLEPSHCFSIVPG